MKDIKLDTTADKTIAALKIVLRSGRGDGSAMAAHSSRNNDLDLFGKVHSQENPISFEACLGFKAFTALKGTIQEENNQTIIKTVFPGLKTFPFFAISLVCLVVALFQNGGFNLNTLLIPGSARTILLFALASFCFAIFISAQRFLAYDGLKVSIKKEIRYQQKQ